MDLTNSTPNPIELPARALESATLLLEVTDARGKRMDPSPPPTPSGETVKFAPGERRAVKVSLGVFSPPLPSGDYIVAPSAGVANGNPATFRIQ